MASADAAFPECALLRALGCYESPLLSQGAEGRVFRLRLLEREAVAKQRFPKRYRHPELDARLTRSRLQAEARSLLKARKLGVLAPLPLHVDVASSTLFLDFVPGCSLKQRLRSGGLGESELASLASRVGRAVARLHDGGMVHGDLTTSNMMLREPDGGLVRLACRASAFYAHQLSASRL
jgi:TP53 regulating kinase-like protein